MSLAPQREYITLLLGDVLCFVVALWASLAVRTVSLPTQGLYLDHIFPFGVLFGVWILTFFLAGLYDKQNRLLQSRLPSLILAVQSINMLVAAVFFFAIPQFGLAPKTILAIYLVISSLFIYIWRIFLFPLIRPRGRSGAIMLASGPDIERLAEEVNSDARFAFKFVKILDVESLENHQIIQQMLRVLEDESISVVVADPSAPVLTQALPLMYDSAFRKRQFAFVDVKQLYEDVFDRVPLTLMRYDWVLSYIVSSRVYDALKRSIDVVGAGIGLVCVAPCMPFIMLAIKLDDAGTLFISQERVGRFFNPIHIWKFRTMSGNESDRGDAALKSKKVVTRVGSFLRKSHLDEVPQLWNILRGDLSFVGPRPELPALAAQYSSRIPFYNARHLITPGLSGWARIRHEADPHHGVDIEETRRKLAYDLYYLKNRSLVLDVFIILQTVSFILGGRGK
jgi:lipopolysaccharide/colanic/teichoic acid biosynthesis glycosyltransferase